MALVPKTSVVPPNGYHFIDRSGPSPVTIYGDSFEDVSMQVMKLRLANNRPVGNPQQELIDYVCLTWPHFCNETNPAAPVPGGNKIVNLSTRVAEWVAFLMTTNPADVGVAPEEVARRASICADCQHNREFRHGCGPCVASINRLYFVFRRDRKVPNEDKLGGCYLTGQHNAAAVLCKNQTNVSAAINAELPTFCWRKAP